MYTYHCSETLRRMNLFLKIPLHYYTGDIYEIQIVQATY